MCCRPALGRTKDTVELVRPALSSYGALRRVCFDPLLAQVPSELLSPLPQRGPSNAQPDAFLTYHFTTARQATIAVQILAAIKPQAIALADHFGVGRDDGSLETYGADLGDGGSRRSDAMDRKATTRRSAHCAASGTHRADARSITPFPYIASVTTRKYISGRARTRRFMQSPDFLSWQPSPCQYPKRRNTEHRFTWFSNKRSRMRT